MVRLVVKCDGFEDFVYETVATRTGGEILDELLDRLSAAPRVAADTSAAGSSSPPLHLPSSLTRDSVHLYFAGNIVDCSKPLSHILGRNEKTTAIVWVHPRGRGRPPRQDPLTTEERQAYMSWQFKRQEALRAALLEGTPDAGVATGWASDSGSLQKDLQGLESVKVWKT